MNEEKLTISKTLVDKLKEIYYVFFDEEFDLVAKGAILDWASLAHLEDDELSEIALDNALVVYAYLNPLTRQFVKVVED